MKKTTLYLLLFAAAILFVGIVGISPACREKSDSPAVARVGSAVLTTDDIHTSIPPEYSDRITREQNINYVKQWIDTELLYQEALRLNIHREKDLRQRIDKMKKDLLCAEVINRYARSGAQARISDDMIEEYYQKHSENFLRDTNVFRYVEIITDSYVGAWKVRNMATTENFLDLAAQYSLVPLSDTGAVSYLRADQIPGEIVAVLATLKIGGTTAPIKTDRGYHVIRLLDKQNPGTIASSREVREEIVDHLSTQVHKQKINTLLSALRLKTDISVDFKLLPETTVQETDSVY